MNNLAFSLNATVPIFLLILLGWFLKKIGGIKVDRNNYDFNFMGDLIKVVDKGGVGLVFPESRIPEPNEEQSSVLKTISNAYNTDKKPVLVRGVTC